MTPEQMGKWIDAHKAEIQAILGARPWGFGDAHYMSDYTDTEDLAERDKDDASVRLPLGVETYIVAARRGR
jgi:hypothetical protein